MGKFQMSKKSIGPEFFVFGVRLVKGGRDQYGGLGLYDYNVLFVIMDMHGLYTG